MITFFGITIRWQDILDVAIVAFFIYRIMIFFAGTRAMQLIRGLLVFVAVAVVAARVLDLRVMQWIGNLLMSAFIISFAVVFQPELRRVLEELGKGSLFPQESDESKMQKRIDAVLSALLHMSQSRTGVLIVFQYESNLKDYWRSGIMLNGDISEELLGTIFWPKTPLHDGAVIINSTSIVAANCYLPVSENRDINQAFGTRHRAALGITEVSDARVIIVSEETGEIRLAGKGILTRPLDEKQIRLFLEQYFGLTQKKKDDARKTHEPKTLLAKIRDMIIGAGRDTAKGE